MAATGRQTVRAAVPALLALLALLGLTAWPLAPGGRPVGGIAPAVAQEPSADSARAAAPSQGDPGDLLLDVPYISQSEALCGGAAVAMVLRYWGAPGVRAEEFAHLVGDPERGIAARDLAEAVRERGFDARPFSGDAALLRRQLEAGRPPVLLIRVRPDRYHYVVVAGVVGGRFLVHDPAAAPNRLLAPEELARRWEPARRYTLLILPPDTTAAAPDPGQAGAPEPGDVSAETSQERPEPARDSAAPDPRPGRVSAETPVEPREAAGVSAGCDSLLARGVALAREFRLEESTTALEAARRCGHPAAARELAGVWLKAARPEAAIEPARAAVRRDPSDAHAARTLGAALYMTDRDRAALAAWNRAGEPRVDLVQFLGLSRTRHRAVEEHVGLEPDDLLTPGRLARSRRRLAALPAARAARLDYRPAPGGLARVEAGVLERPLVPWGVLPLAALAGRAALQREVVVDVASPTGGGELLTVAGRWWESRPRVSASLVAPAPITGAVWEASGAWERQTYALASDPSAREERARAALDLRRWATGAVAWRLGAALDRFRAPDVLDAGDGSTGAAGAPGATDAAWGTAAGLSAGLTLRPPADAFAVSLDAAGWASPDDGDPFAALGATADWRSRPRPRGTVLSLAAGARLASGHAPLALWPGAGTGQARAALARAHPLLDGEGVLDGPLFGRRLLSGTAELTRWVALPDVPIRAGLAAFVDGALAAGRPLAGTADAVDVGVGLRLSLPGMGELRVDAATALLDGEEAISAAFRPPWPGRDVP